MRKITKTIAAVMLLFMALAMVPATATKASTKKAKTGVTYTLKKGTLTIQGKGKMPKKMVFKNNKKIKKVIIKKGVTSIPKNAFYNCKNLKKVTIGKSVKTIGKRAFARTKITKVKIPDSTKTIGRYAFDRCKKLKKVTLGKSVKTIEMYAFQYTKIEKIRIPDATKTIERCCFCNCKKLSKVTFGKSLKTIGSGAFSGTAVRSITIPDKTESIGNSAFVRCKKLEKVTLGKSVKNIGNMAFQFTKISSIVIPNSLKTIGTSAFSSDNKITVTMPGDFKVNGYSSSVIRNASNIKFTTNLNLECIQYLDTERFEVMSSDPNFTSIDGNIYTKDKKTLVRIPASATNIRVAEGCETVCVSAFQYNVAYNFKLTLNKTIKKLYLPETVKSIDNKSYITYTFSPESMYAEAKNAVKIEQMEIRNKDINTENLLQLLDSVNCNKEEILKSL